MISDVDEALRNLILDSLTVSRQNVDIKYDLPSRDWASRLNRPTIDLFLFDIRENLRLRGAEQARQFPRPDGKVEIRRNPVRIDLRYLLTAWTKDPEDEHLLLSDTLMTLLRNPVIPDKYATEQMKKQQFPVILDAAVYQPEHGPTEKATEIWGVIGNDIHAGFIVTVTITVDPYEPLVFPQVSSIERNLGQTSPDGGRAVVEAGAEKYNEGFFIRTKKYEPSTLTVVLEERNEVMSVDDEYRVKLPTLPAGKYHLNVLYRGKILKRQVISIPAEDKTVVL
ncbi:MAG: DUF4255 domain-containing protein [Anaerolineaceae bacterium]|nr:DUF4255 domain-containing protein [Anaerolineaceae bacterium]